MVCSPQAEGSGEGQPPETTSDESQHSKHFSPELYHQLPPGAGTAASRCQGSHTGGEDASLGQEILSLPLLWRKKKVAAQGEQSWPGSIRFSQPREEGKEVHPWVLLFSLFKADGFKVLSALGYPTHRAPSAECYFLAHPCTGESVFPKDGESDGQDDNVVFLVLSS